MADPPRSELAELRDVEERVAARMARIDQLQAEVSAASHRSARFTRTLLIVGCISTFAAGLLDVQPLGRWTLALVLAGTALTLTILVAVMSLLIASIYEADALRGRKREKIHRRAVDLCVRCNPGWRPFSSAYRVAPPTTAGITRFLLPSLAIGLPAAVILTRAGGAFGLTLLALICAVALLSGIWSRRLLAPSIIARLVVLLALLSATSAGAYAGIWAFPAQPQRRTPVPHRVVPDSGAPLVVQRATPAPVVRAPTYEELCGAEPRWMGGGGSSALARLGQAWQAVGAEIAGCPASIRTTASADGRIVLATGLCEGLPVSLGVADSSRGAIVLGQAATIVQSLAEQELRSVPSQVSVSGGSLYLVTTSAGTSVLVPRSVGAADSGAHARGCAGLAEPAYAVLPPALTSLWVALMSQSGWAWPVPSSDGASTAGPAHASFSFVNQDRVTVARASCDLATDTCQRRLGSGTALNYRGGGVLSAEQLMRFAPSSG